MHGNGDGGPFSTVTQHIGKLVVVVSAFPAEEEGDLSLEPGDIVEVLGERGGWFKGVLNGKKGIFPSDSVRLLTDEEAKEYRASNTAAVPPPQLPSVRPPVPAPPISLPPLPPASLSHPPPSLAAAPAAESTAPVLESGTDGSRATQRRPLPMPPSSTGSNAPRSKNLPYIPAGAVPMLPFGAPPLPRQPGNSNAGGGGSNNPHKLPADADTDDIAPAAEDLDHRTSTQSETLNEGGGSGAPWPSRPLPQPPKLPASSTSITLPPPDLPPPPPPPRRSNTYSSADDGQDSGSVAASSRPSLECLEEAEAGMAHHDQAASKAKKSKDYKSGHRISRLFKMGKKPKDKGENVDEAASEYPDIPPRRTSVSDQQQQSETIPEMPLSFEEHLAPPLPSLPPVTLMRGTLLMHPVCLSLTVASHYSRAETRKPARPPMPPLPQPVPADISEPPQPMTKAKKVDAISHEEVEGVVAPARNMVPNTDKEAPPAEGDEESKVAAAAECPAPRGEAAAQEPSNADSEKSKPMLAKLARVLRDYKAESSEELELAADDVLTIIHRGTENDPRWKGESHGRIGYFPGGVVEPIEASAEDEDTEGGGDADKPKKFKLAAYGVKQGGLGSILASGNMPVLRKTSRPKQMQQDFESKDQERQPAAVPVPPIQFKLRSVRGHTGATGYRADSEDKAKGVAEEKRPTQVVGLVPQLSASVPGKDVESDQTEGKANIPSISEHPASEDRAETMAAMGEDGGWMETEQAIATAKVGDDKQEEEEEEGQKVVNAEDSIKTTEVSSEEHKESWEDIPESSAKPETEEEEEVVVAEKAKPVVSAENDRKQYEGEEQEVQGEYEEEEESKANKEETSPKSPELAPIKPPALIQGKKKVLRRGPPRRNPTPDALKQAFEEAQTKILETALEKDKDRPVSPVERPAPILPPKPKGLANRGIPLPKSGFQASSKVGSATASRIAALQRRLESPRADDGDDDDAETTTSTGGSTSAEIQGGTGPVAGFTSLTKPFHRANTTATNSGPGYRAMSPPTSVATVEDKWRQSIDQQLRQLTDNVASITSRLAPEAIVQSIRTTVTDPLQQKLQQEIQGVQSELTSLHTRYQQVQATVDGLPKETPLTKAEIQELIESRVAAVLKPLSQAIEELTKENQDLRKQVKDLRNYVDELTVDEE
ncbi:hypothetical protein EV182_000811 [Spiromyces aspiralis]|uniref:Uncharacterized protein n=1 Tax=Spiromyces aspiralis TaxID=68401 RepID=A0ACC1HXI9_9FUNG|nr:hypothetical protein EV182_000811 [Spiromyces aspiralis]